MALRRTSRCCRRNRPSDVPAVVRREWRALWLVDPPDGTREFIKRNGEFTVNIALIDDARCSA